MLLLAGATGLLAAHVTVFALDESIMQQSAVHYASGLPHSLVHDADARATDRLYSLVLSIAYRVTGGPAAVRIDHVLSALMFVSAALPIYLLARALLASRWAAAMVALLSVAVPWLTLTSALFTENLSYPIFWWVMLAICAAIWAPAPRRDLLVLASMGLLVGTRVQFVAIMPGYLLCMLTISFWRAPSAQGGTRRLRAALAEVIRRFPFTLAIMLVLVIGVAYARTDGHWHAHVVRLLGSYTDVVTRDGLPNDMTEGLLVELIALGLGVGLIPVIVSVPWYMKRLAHPQMDRHWVYLAVIGAVLLVFLVLTVYSQGGYLGNFTEERYFFYVIPVFWIGAFSALAEGRLRARELLASAIGFAALCGAIPMLSPLSEETAFLAPVESVISHVISQRTAGLGLTGLSVQDALVAIVLAGGLLTALLWVRRPGARLWWTIGVGALIQLLIAGYAFAVIDGQVPGIQGRTSGSATSLGWIDRHAGDRTVTWLDNLSTAQPLANDVTAAGLAADQSHVTLFWNSQVGNWAWAPAADATPVEFPLSALPAAGTFTVEPTSGLLAPSAAAEGLQEVVGQTESPFLQLAGESVAHSPDGFLTLNRSSRPVRARWMSVGLRPDSYVAAGTPVQVRAFGAAGTALSVSMTFIALPAPASGQGRSTAVVIRLGASRRKLALRSGASAELRLTSCLGAGQSALSGTIEAVRAQPLDGSLVAAALRGVSVSSARCDGAGGRRREDRLSAKR